MKNLTKGLMSLVVVMLISVSVSAQTGGTCTVEVVPGLEVCVENNYDVEFTYDAYGETSDLDITQELMVTANAAWKLDITATQMTNSAGFLLENISVNGNDLDAAIPTFNKAAADASISLSWLLNLTPDMGVLAGNYNVADLDFTFALQ